MQRDRHALVLKDCAGKALRELLQSLPRLRDGGDVKTVLTVPAPNRIAALKAVYAGRGPSMRAKEPVEFDDRATTDQCDRSREDGPKTGEQIQQARLDLYRVRGRRDIEQRAVNIQKQAPR
jgi:hypothetical protein